MADDVPPGTPRGGKAKGVFNAKWGPVPIWTIVLAGAGVGFWYWRHQQSASNDTSTDGSNADASSQAAPTELTQGGAMPYTTTGDYVITTGQQAPGTTPTQPVGTPAPGTMTPPHVAGPPVK